MHYIYIRILYSPIIMQGMHWKEEKIKLESICNKKRNIGNKAIRCNLVLFNARNYLIFC